MPTKAFIHRLYLRPLDGAAIEKRSLDIIDEEVGPHDHPPQEWTVVRRLIHASADPSLAEQVRFSPDAVTTACDALRSGRPVVVDSNMIRAGLSMDRLRQAFRGYRREHVHCAVADADVVDQARRASLPRALFAVRKARPELEGGIALFGNSPVGLLELNRLILEEGLRPALVIGMPVGFVHVQESKEELTRLPVPWIVVNGRRGGSPLAVAALHALCGLAMQGATVPEAEAGDDGVPEQTQEAIILLGHGSRVPGAGDSMELVAAELRVRHPGVLIEICFMSRLGPHFPETFERCVAAGARRVLVMPYFLHCGMHIQIDVPCMLKASAALHPEVRVVYGDRLGYDAAFVDVVERRIRAARSLPDVRELILPSPESFPLPPGQDELVPMPPEEAERWKRAQQSACEERR